jgi:SAM-dependent methyltransferase
VIAGTATSEVPPWEQIAPIMFDQQRWCAAEGEVEQAVRLLGAEPPARVLDLACGPGRHALELARRGFRVTGVDATAAFVVEASSLAAIESLGVEVVHDDMRAFCRPEGFDYVLNMATSFGYFEDPADDRRVLENVRRSLNPGGALLMELMGKEVVARTLEGPRWGEDDGGFLLTEQCIRDGWGWVDNRLIFLIDGARQEIVLSHRLYSAAELTGLLETAGFAEVAVAGDLSGSPYGASATSLVVVARA